MSAISPTSMPGGRFSGGPVPSGPGAPGQLDALPPPPRRTRWFYRQSQSPFMPFAVGALVAGGCVYSLINDPNSSGAYPQCTFNQVTGLDCPGCGLTRGVHALITGHPVQALNHNILLLLVVPITIFAYVKWAGSIWFGWRLPSVKVPRFAGIAAGVLVISFWVVRNLPWGPLTWLNATA